MRSEPLVHIYDPMICSRSMFVTVEPSKNNTFSKETSMKKFNKNMLVLSALALAPATGFAKEEAKTTTLVVDTTKVIEGSKLGREKMEELEIRRKEILGKMEPMRKELASKENDLKEKGATVSDATRKKMVAELEVARANLEQLYQQSTQPWQAEAQKTSQEIQEVYRSCVAKLGKEESERRGHPVVIVDQSTGSVLYNTAQTDLTKAATEEMNREYQRIAATEKDKTMASATATAKASTPTKSSAKTV